MLRTLAILLTTVRSLFRSRADLLVENAALRGQLDVYQRQVRRPKLRRGDRMFWVWLCRHSSRWRDALVIVKPETVLAWHRKGYAAFWRWRSKGRPGRPRIPQLHIAFIRRISSDHPEWGEDRIALELKLKLGVEHSTSTIRRYMVEDRPSGTSTWRKFLASHADQTFAIDFTTHCLWDFSMRHIFVVLAIGTREVVHVAVTANPTLAWVKQQLREATPWGQVPRFLTHDNDGIYGQFGKRRGTREGATGKKYRCALDAWLDQALGIEGIPIPFGAPNAAAYIERYMGTLRRECLEHFIFLSEGHLARTVREFARYTNEARPHQGIHGIPTYGPGTGPLIPEAAAGRPLPLIAHPVLGGLAHDYRLAA